MVKLAPVNPRNYMPSRADPEHRSRRKELEKEHPFTWKEPLVLGMIGIGLAWNIEKQVQKREERKEREEQQQQGRDSNNDRRRRRRDQEGRDCGSYGPWSQQDGESRRSKSSNKGSSEDRRRSQHRSGGSDHSVGKDTVELERSRRSNRDRVQSVDVRRHEDPRYINDDRYYEQSRYDRGYDDDDRREWDREYRGRRSRRDSW
ncbi:hypothetical protein F5Y00DRAFT_178566 [Daldinia vernicosa]|uniref:uncharacterized protein n=1 Tax=Daldinia vernicosa TaxID=114800 RepID=UPI002007558D|nr:uncharacterized protein F5Y00DRAFT_178566 [Daldinia vernicosa]KAI0852706.1 hypothetical protein F5Y00DRAFT_178566 [Daldinia vernicosa]